MSIRVFYSSIHYTQISALGPKVYYDVIWVIVFGNSVVATADWFFQKPKRSELAARPLIRNTSS